MAKATRAVSSKKTILSPASLDFLKKYLSAFDPTIAAVKAIHGPNRDGDIPHSLASIDKAKNSLGYHPLFNFQEGLRLAVEWYKKKSLQRIEQ